MAKKAAAEKKLIGRSTHERGPSQHGHGKKYNDAVKLITQEMYSVEDACVLLPQLSTTKFDATAEIHIAINADTTQADQLVRTTVDLPHGTGKKVRIAAFVPDDLVKDAKAAGADVAGAEDLIKDIESGKIEFDVAVAVPAMMKNLGKIAKILGQRGLMPNPKAGTVTEKFADAIAALKKGRIEVKMDKFGIIHAPFGKISFGSSKLEENLKNLLQAVKDAQPSGIKGIYIRSISVAPTMGPGLQIKQ